MEENIEENEQYDEDEELLEDDEELYPEDSQEGEDWDFGGSDPVPLGGIYGLFKDTLDRKDSTKVSNLTAEEIGVWDMSVRDCKRVALISETFRHPGVAKFFNSQSRIITDTAMSKRGWFTELFVTSKKYASRDSSSSIKNLPQSNTKSKWKIFSNQQSTINQEQQT